MAKSETTATIFVAIVANLGIAIAKGVVAAITGSASLFSETIHSVVDTLNECLLLLGEHRSRKPADARHPFGYGKEMYFWSLVVAIVVFGIGGGMSIVEGVHRLAQPEPLANPVWSYAVLAFAFVLESISWAKAFSTFRETTSAKTPRSLYRALRASKDPGVFVVLYEDSAALAGLAVAFAGTLLSQLTGEPRFDATASVLIGLVLAIVAVGLVAETRGLLIGESAAPDIVASIRSIADADPRVSCVRRLLTMQLAPDSVLVNIDLELYEHLGEHDASEAINEIEDTIRERHPEARMIFIEVESLPARIAAASRAATGRG